MRDFLQQWMQNNPAPWYIGEIGILPDLELRHQGDVDCPAANLNLIPNFEALRKLARFDREGRYRPVRGFIGMPNGWRFETGKLDLIIAAVNGLYPLALPFWFDWKAGKLAITEFEQTAARQTGLYANTKKIAPDRLAALIRENCEASCLKQRLWLSAPAVIEQSSRIPLICPEACNYLISRAQNYIL